MKPIILVIYCAFLSLLMQAQAPPIEWQKTLGSNADDYVSTVNQTIDGGYIVCGTTYGGVGGDKTEGKKGENDYWIIKLNATGSVEWQNTIYGNLQESATIAIQSADGGYLIAGESISSDQFDKTESSNGFDDIWILKLDGLGNIVWQNTIGGGNGETMRDVIQTADGGYLLMTYSVSDSSGDKTENTFVTDVWLVKTDALGNVIWDNTIVGISRDYGTKIVEDGAGNYFLGCSSMSNIGYDKTATNKGWMDYWVIKINSIGEILWQETYGGPSDDSLEDLLLTSDGGFICVGTSTSNAGENKTENGFGVEDWWIIKIDEQFNIEWDRSFGGSGIDNLKSVLETSDGDFLLSGISASGISGNKTVPLSGANDMWLIKLDENGNEIWQDGIGGNGVDQAWDIIHTTDGGYCIAGNSDSNISGDKTENRRGQYDYWIVKLAADPCIPAVEICNGIDDDCDGITDEDSTLFAIVIPDGDTTFCQGGNVLLTAEYSGDDVQWSRDGINIPGATENTYTANKTGLYAVTTSNACSSVTSTGVNVLVNKKPKAVITADGPTTFCVGFTVVLTANPSGGSTYQWYRNGDPIGWATTINYVVTNPGNYKCLVTKTATGCFKFSNTIAVSMPCKEGEELPENNGVYVYPNPSSDYFTVDVNQTSIHEIKIYSQSGALVKHITNWQGEQIYAGDLPKGLYNLMLVGDTEILHAKCLLE